MITMSNRNPNRSPGQPQMSKEDRDRAIREAAQKAGARPASQPPKPAAPAKSDVKVPAPVKAPKPQIKPAAKLAEDDHGADVEGQAKREAGNAATKRGAKDPNMLTVGDVARELGIDPKRARARLRAAGKVAVEGRWPKVRRGSREHDELIGELSLDDTKRADEIDAKSS